MSMGYRSKRQIAFRQGYDSAFYDRQADLRKLTERDADLARWADNALLYALDCEAKREPEAGLWVWTWRFVVAAALVVLFGVTA